MKILQRVRKKGEEYNLLDTVGTFTLQMTAMGRREGRGSAPLPQLPNRSLSARSILKNQPGAGPFTSVVESQLRTRRMMDVNVLNRSRDELVPEALALLDKVGLEDKKNAYPVQLSGGQRQRVAISHAACDNAL